MQALTEQRRKALAKKWHQAIEDKSLRDLPYKMEQDQWGHLVMSPAANYHGLFQAEIVTLLSQAMPDEGKVLAECSIETPEGIKVPDVVWCSAAFFKRYGVTTPYPVAPEICIEVLSPSNSKREMLEKKQLYFSQGALEVWIVDSKGKIDYYAEHGKLSQSAIVKGLPTAISAF